MEESPESDAYFPEWKLVLNLKILIICYQYIQRPYIYIYIYTELILWILIYINMHEILCKNNINFPL